MPEHDTHMELGQPEAAGWVLGALDAGEAEIFREHLKSCAGCQAAVAELQPAARMLRTAAPAAGPPASLQERTLAGVRRAAQPRRPPGRIGAWRRWNIRMLSLAAAASASVAVAAIVALQVLQPGAANAVTIPLHARPGVTGSGQAVARLTATGWSIQLTVHGLKDLGRGRSYECWYVSPGSRPGHPDLSIAGQFTVGADGSATKLMSSIADAHNSAMQITAELTSDTLKHGPVILVSGH